MKTIERQLRIGTEFGRIRRAVKPQEQGALDHVDIMEDSWHLDPTTGERVKMRRKVCTTQCREELETAIVDRNKGHFAQAKETPYHQPPLRYICSDNDFNMYEDAQGTPINLP